MRSGGAIAAANLGVNDLLFQKHGRWKSERVKNGDVHENISVLLQVTKNLGHYPLLLITHDATTGNLLFLLCFLLSELRK